MFKVQGQMSKGKGKGSNSNLQTLTSNPQTFPGTKLLISTQNVMTLFSKTWHFLDIGQ